MNKTVDAQKRDWTLFYDIYHVNPNFPKVTLLSNMMFRGPLNKPEPNALGTYSLLSNTALSTIGVNTYFNDEGVALVSVVSNQITGTDVYAKGVLIGTLPCWDDEVGIFHLKSSFGNPANDQKYHIIVADKVYELNTYSQPAVLNPTPIELTLQHAAPPGSSAHDEFEGGCAIDYSSTINSNQYRVYTVQRSYTIDPAKNTATETFEIIETGIEANVSLSMLYKTSICTLATNVLTVQNGIPLSFKNTSYCEMEFCDGKIAIGEGKNIYIYDYLNNNLQTRLATENITGLEFNQKHKNELYISYENPIAPVADHIGLSIWDYTANTFKHLKNSDEYCKSQLETGKNKDIFCISNIHATLRGLNTQIFSDNGIQQYCSTVSTYINNGHSSIIGSYRLPEQIDEWNNNNNFGFGGAALYTATAANCHSYNLIPNANGTAAKYYYDQACNKLAGASGIGQPTTVEVFSKYNQIWGSRYWPESNCENGPASTVISLSNYASINPFITTSGARHIDNYNLSREMDTVFIKRGDQLLFTAGFANNINNPIVQWDLGEGTLIANWLQATTTYTRNGMFDVTLKVTFNNCSEKTVIKVVVTDEIEFMNPIPAWCESDEYNLLTNYAGYPKGGVFKVNNVNIGNTIAARSLAPGQYTLLYEIYGQTLSSVFTIKSSLPAPTLTPSNTPTDLCQGNSISFTTGAADPRWYLGTLPLTINNGIQNYTYSAQNMGANIGFIGTLRTLTVRDMGGNGCQSDKAIVQVQLHNVPYVNTSASDFYFCKGIAVNQVLYACAVNPTQPSACFMGAGQQTIQWFKNGNPIAGATGASYTITSAMFNTTEVYHYETYSDLGKCPRVSGNYTLHAVGDLVVTTSLNPLPNLGATSILSITNATDYISVEWLYNGNLLTNAPTISISQPGQYTAIGYSLCGTKYYQVDITTNCGLQIAHTPISSNITYSAPLTRADITIYSPSTLTINSTTITMQSCSRIIVKSGASLVINGSKIIGCDQWVGIVVEDGGSLTINAAGGVNSEISGAYAGIYYKKIANGNSAINVQYCDFGNNTSHIVLANKTSTSTFAHCNFYSLNNAPTCSVAANMPAMQNPTIRKQVYIEACADVHFTQSVFKGQATIGNAFSRYAIEGYNLSSANQNLEVNEFGFTGTYTEAIRLLNCKNVDITGSSNTDNIWGTMNAAIHAINGSKVKVTNTRISDAFANPPPASPPIVNGIWFEQTDECTVSKCKIHYCTNGLQYFNSHANQATNTITENVFSNNQFGLVIASTSHPYTCGNLCNNTRTNTLQMNIGCNNFIKNKVGIFGCGDLPEVGNVNAESGNILKWANAADNNIDWDFLWDDLNGNNPLTNINLDPTYWNINTVNPTIPYTMNANNAFNLSGFKGFQTAAIAGCRNISRPLTPFFIDETTISNKDWEVVVFPNPFDENIQVQILNYAEGDVFKIELFDFLGRKIITEAVVDYSCAIDGAKLSAGTYFLKCYINDKHCIKKIVKINE